MVTIYIMSSDYKVFPRTRFAFLSLVLGILGVVFICIARHCSFFFNQHLQHKSYCRNIRTLFTILYLILSCIIHSKALKIDWYNRSRGKFVFIVKNKWHRSLHTVIIVIPFYSIVNNIAIYAVEAKPPSKTHAQVLDPLTFRIKRFCALRLGSEVQKS